jgi:uncharacterized protein
MKWSIHQLNKYRSKGLTLDETIRFQDVEEWNSDIRSLYPVHVTGKADLGVQKFTFYLHIEGTMILPCSRTLVDVPFPFEIETTEVFLTSEEQYEAYADVHYLQGEVLDLFPVIKENILLQVPMQVFNEDASNRALTKGQDWQVVTEEDKTQKIDPRLEGLAKFFDK